MGEEKRGHDRQEEGTVLQRSLALEPPWGAAPRKRDDKETPSRAAITGPGGGRALTCPRQWCLSGL